MNWQCCPHENVKKDIQFIKEEASRKAEELFPLAAGCSQAVVDEVSIRMAFLKEALECISGLQISHHLQFCLQYSLFDISVECNDNSDCSGKSPTTLCEANKCGKF